MKFYVYNRFKTIIYNNIICNNIYYLYCAYATYSFNFFENFTKN